MNQLLSVPRFIPISILIFVTSFFTFSQKDFNNYQTLLSRGEMPADFKSSVADKAAQDLLTSDLSFPSKTDAQNYWMEIHSELNEVLYSGNVIYGDEISSYVREVASNLLKGNPELLKKL